MANRLFGSIPANKPKRNAFNLSFVNNLSLNFGELIPILCKEVVPGDKFRITSEAVIRMAPMLAPIMGQVDCYIHYFFVPNRIIWKDWENFITGGLTGDDYGGPFVPPYIAINNEFIEKYGYVGDDSVFDCTLYDYLNLPSIFDPDIEFPEDEDDAFKISSLPMRAYQLIYQEYYADELLYSDDYLNIDEGGNELDINAITNPNHSEPQVNSDLFTIRKRSWGKDYFTTARPQPALGGDVYIPVSGTGDFSGMEVSGTGIVDYQVNDNHTGVMFRNTYGEAFDSSSNGLLGVQSTGLSPVITNYGLIDLEGYNPQEGNLVSQVIIDPKNTLKVDGSDFEVSGEGDITVTAGTIRDLNRAIALQKFNERSSVAGNRYIEFIKAHFGVVSSDARLQRPQYIGGVKSPVMISEVLQTSGSDYSAASGKTATPQGNMAGHGMGVAKSRSFRFFAEEYGFVMGIMSIIPKTSYQNGLPKMFTKFDRFDYFMPEFANIGEQEVKNYELFTKLTNSESDNKTFGYQSRFAEYKFSNNEVHGDFRRALSFWHTGRIFSSLPALNQNFVQVSPISQGLNRIFAVTSNAYGHFYCEIFNNIKAIRPMPIFGSFTI